MIMAFDGLLFRKTFQGTPTVEIPSISSYFLFEIMQRIKNKHLRMAILEIRGRLHVFHTCGDGEFRIPKSESNRNSIILKYLGNSLVGFSVLLSPTPRIYKPSI